jgi:hypothetical protein
MTADAYQKIFDFVTTSFVKREPIMIDYLVNQIQYFFEIAISANTMSHRSHILHRMRNIKTVMGIPMERSRVAVDPTPSIHFRMILSGHSEESRENL